MSLRIGRDSFSFVTADLFVKWSQLRSAYIKKFISMQWKIIWLIAKANLWGYFPLSPKGRICSIIYFTSGYIFVYAAELPNPALYHIWNIGRCQQSATIVLKLVLLGKDCYICSMAAMKRNNYVKMWKEYYQFTNVSIMLQILFPGWKELDHWDQSNGRICSITYTTH